MRPGPCKPERYQAAITTFFLAPIVLLSMSVGLHIGDVENAHASQRFEAFVDLGSNVTVQQSAHFLH
jgi:hypothetical protein